MWAGLTQLHHRRCSQPTAAYPAAGRDRRHERQFPGIGCAHYAHLIHVKPQLFAGSVHLVAYSRTASGAKITRSPTDQQTTASSGCWAGQACTRSAGLGLPKSERHAAASDDIGFHSATGWSQPGMPWVGTKALEMNVSGRKMMKPVCWAASALRSSIPRQTPAQGNA